MKHLFELTFSAFLILIEPIGEEPVTRKEFEDLKLSFLGMPPTVREARKF